MKRPDLIFVLVGTVDILHYHSATDLLKRINMLLSDIHEELPRARTVVSANLHCVLDLLRPSPTLVAHKPHHPFPTGKLDAYGRQHHPVAACEYTRIQ